MEDQTGIRVDGRSAPSTLSLPMSLVSETRGLTTGGSGQAKPDHYDLPPVVIGHWSRSEWFLGWFGGVKPLHLGAAERARKRVDVSASFHRPFPCPCHGNENLWDGMGGILTTTGFPPLEPCAMCQPRGSLRGLAPSFGACADGPHLMSDAANE